MTTSGPAAAKFWDDRYGEGGFAYGMNPNDYLKETLSKIDASERKGKRCLLLADGEGRNGVYMAELGYDVVSVDYSPVGLAKAKELAAQRGVSITTVEADLNDYDLGQAQWDCVVGIFCHLPPPVRAKVLTAIPDSLKQGGMVIFECYTPDQIEKKTGGPPVAGPMYSQAIFSDAFSGKLTIERNAELIRNVHEGPYHNGESAVVQFFGRKM